MEMLNQALLNLNEKKYELEDLYCKIMEEDHEESSYSVIGNPVSKINDKCEDGNNLPVLQND